MRLQLLRPSALTVLLCVLAFVFTIGMSGCFNDNPTRPEEPTTPVDTPGTGDPADDGSNDDDSGDTPGDDSNNDDSGDDSNNDDSGDTPDNPPPPPIGDTGLAGGSPLSGFWEGWVGRHRMGEKFNSYGDYGTMANNTTGAVKMDMGSKGWFEVDIYYDTEFHPGEGGGQHLIGIFSQSARGAGPYDPDYPNLDGWLRLDMAVRQDELRGVIFQDDSSQRTFTTASYEFHAWKQWDTLRVEWDQRDGEIDLTINGRRTTHTTARGLNPIGNLLMVGNMDRNTGSRCEGDNDPCGTVGEIRYRNFRWGRD